MERTLNKKEQKLLDLVQEKLEHKDQILFAVFAAIRYGFVDDLIFFIEDEPDATPEDVIEYVTDMTYEMQLEAGEYSKPSTD